MAKLVTLNDLCETLKVSRTTLYRWRKQDLLPEPVKRWGTPRYDWDEVERALREKKSLKLFHSVSLA